MKLFNEAFVIGIATIILGSFFRWFVENYLSQSCKNFKIEMSLFLTGFFLHLICEYSGINRWYCKNGNACL